MAFDVQELRQSTFWNKKLDLAARVHDTNNSGDISRADYELVRERYKNLGASPQHMEMLSKYQTGILDRLGLTDESVRRSYAELKESFIAAKASDYNQFFGAFFQILDLNGDGFISLDEWKKHYYCYGIDQAHAPASFNAMDKLKNKDGKISKEEFVNFHYEFYFTAENKLGSAILFGPLD